ncbi:MAG: sulfotransferase domain-containing protein [Actinobacteria bacterium]|nr:sulfotransferase domain-containing protein [Actinomycetota bacterium]
MRLRALVQRAMLRPQRRTPPTCPDGWTTAPPDFVGVAAQRSGTTWWYHLIESHPQVVKRDRLKELHYLTKFWNRPFTDVDAAAYELWFPRPPGHVAGEWSPGYLSHFWVPGLLHRAAPDAKILVLLRDPVERFRSGLMLQSETRRVNFTGAGTAFRIGCYGSQLAHLRSYFPQERIQILQFERCIQDAKRELARTYAFLGLDDGYVPPDIGGRRNESKGTKPALADHSRAALVRAYEPEVRQLLGSTSEIDLSLWPNFTHLA